MTLPPMVRVLNQCRFEPGPSDPELSGIQGDVVFVEVCAPLEFAQFIAGTLGVYMSEKPNAGWFKMEIDPNTTLQ